MRTLVPRALSDLSGALFRALFYMGETLMRFLPRKLEWLRSEE
jgi:hypothetical protein